MTNCWLAWSNAVKTGTLTAGSSAAGLGPAQLQDDRGSPATAWQTAAGVTTSWLRIDTARILSKWQLFGLFRTNLTAAATMRWRVSTVSDFSTTVYDSGVLNPAGIVAGFQQAVLIAPSQVTGRYARVDITDSANPDAFLNVPLMFAGPGFQPTTNLDFTTTLGRDDQTDEATTRGGQEYPQPLWNRRRMNVSLQGLRGSEVWPSVMALDAFARSTAGNVLFILDPDSADLNREAVFGRLKSTADVGYPFQSADRRAWKATITERL